jgi:hypothetical protein
MLGKKIKSYLNDPFSFITRLIIMFPHLIWSDKVFLKLKYYTYFHRWLDFDNPKTFNEKIQWLKVYNRCSDYVNMVDKSKAKQYAAKIIGEKYMIPTLGVFETVDEIDFDKLPKQFVLKCTHDSGGIVVCKDKTTLDIAGAKKKLKAGLRTNFFWKTREWPYKQVKPRIIAEQYMEDKDTNELRDYKFFCFNGEPKIMFVATERQKEGTETKFDFFDTDYNHLDIINGHPMADVPPQKPKNFDLMLSLAMKLSQGIPHVRIDFYEVNGKVFFGEFTFSHWSGNMPFEPEEWDYQLGEWLSLPAK